MSSTASSSSSSVVTPSQRIDEILMTSAEKPNFDLSQLIEHIDALLVHYGAQPRKKNPIREKLGELPSAAGASNLAEQVSTNVKQIANEIKECSGNKHETSIAVLNAIGNVHWIAVGFLVVGAVLNVVDTIENNKEECFRLLKSMNDLAKVILQLQRLPTLKELHMKLKESINLIVDGAILCCSQKKKKMFIKRVFKASTDGQELQKLSKDIDDMCKFLSLQINVSTLEAMQNFQTVSPTPIPALNNDAVGIKDKIEEVIQQLDWENDSVTTTAVIVYGIGGSGKTTLADAVYTSLKDKLHGWKHSKITLIQNLKEDPKVEDLQSLILQDLTATKQDVRDFESGRQSLKEIIEKESIFLYIDNVLFLEPLKKLLPKDIASAKKLRLLLTARETTVSQVIEGCEIEPCKLYHMEPLSDDAALQVLCRKIDKKREKDSILQERPQAKKIAEKCSCCPLFLEVIGAYIHQRKNSVEAYERVLDWLQSGEDFGGSEKYSFDEQRVLFSYDGLKSSAKEAFLDLCSFFYGPVWKWEWDDMACILGDEEMECLQEGALIKREDKRIKIHDLILAAGRNKSKDSRLNDVEDFSLALKNKEVKGIWMENYSSPSLLSAEELDTTSRSLRVFYMNEAATVKGKCREHFDNLRFLHVERRLPDLPITIFHHKHLRYLSINSFKEDIILSPSMNLPNLNVLKFRCCRIHGIAEIAHLRSLKQLDLSGCNTDGISQCFLNLHNLRRLKLSSCEDVTELPESLVNLRSLEELHLVSCSNLKRLPAGFGELVSLTVLYLSYCSSLQELPCDLEKLPSLQSLNISSCSSLLCLPAGLENSTSLISLEISGCTSLKCLPDSIGGMSVWGSNINFISCSSLSELPVEICKHAMLTNISLMRCSSLKMLPSGFGELTCLQHLSLSGCESLQELCNDFHCLVGLKTVDLRDCKSLSSLPLDFGKLSSLETLDLSRCDRLEELCSDFHCLGALKYLYLSNCNSICKLPDRFGELSCLERLDLSGCSNLVKLSDDFHLLRSLTSLNLSKCENLGGEWMDSAGSMRSLWRFDIVHSERMIQRWMETKSQKERNLVVVTDFPQGSEGETAFLLEGVLSKIFDEEGLLLDAHQHPFNSSSLQPQTPLIFIIDSEYDFSHEWGTLGKNLQQLQCTSKEMRIIYVGRRFKSMTSELPVRILAYTPDNSQTSSFCHKLSAMFNARRSIAVFRSTDQLEQNGLKCLSAWEDISFILDRVDFLTNTPRESNIELLRELLVTEKTDYLLLKENLQVKVADLQGKLILLLVTDLDENQVIASAVKEMYLKMQESHDHLLQVVWVPIPWYNNSSWEEFERAAANAPWPVVPNPWLIKERIKSLIGEWTQIPCICVVDEKGRISNKDAMATIDRWGVEAYPFSQGREEELWKAEWEEIKFNSLPTVQFVFQNLEFLPNKAKEMMDRGAMMLICVGPAKEMMELAPDLNCALTMLEMELQVFYVARSDISPSDHDDMCWQKLKQNESEMCSIATLSSSDIYKFWRRVKHLQNDLINGMGTDERIVNVRRMVLGLASAEYKRWEGIRILVVDGNGEIVSVKGMELVELLCHGDEDSKEKLVEDIKKKGVGKSVESRWRDGIIHPKHYPQHHLLKLRNSYGIRCSLCGEQGYRIYQCNVCEKYGMCRECSESSV
ncbi:hypothetical protein SUGI_1088340 [Cryptomeria japonica]|uniref:uncharacterized protein LOC131026980 isoform X2 n=1 Tax=Cryptomeria japonica TaxID=3369 RepID=UPI00241487CA|nr:uncharacterized protein LOC131026980 isoform X2 [Cryptomeria japonica]GLJ51126.1 hypothetical protein SUGI_1088340 [Cryptomeria japonica]